MLVREVKKIKMGQPDDFSSFVTAVIDKSSFNNIKSYIDEAKVCRRCFWCVFSNSLYSSKASKDCEIITGGKYDDSKGYFIEPTVVVVKDPKHKMMREEIF